MNKYKKVVQEKLSTQELLEQLAEEASEVAQAALKCIRALGLSNNKTPVTPDEAINNLCEEVMDVLVVLDALDMADDTYEYHSDKWKRWAERLSK